VEVIYKLGGRTWIGVMWLGIEMDRELSHEHKKAAAGDYFSSANPLHFGVSKCSESALKSNFLFDNAHVRRDMMN
jgi:hypothetical protein